jgi:hypothetical protein
VGEFVKTQATDLSVGNLAIAGDDFRRSLRAANKSPKTVKTYMEAVWELDVYLGTQGMPAQSLPSAANT